MQIKYDQKNTLYYITYQSKNNKKTQSTDETEVNLKEQAAAKAKAATQAKAKAQAQANANKKTTKTTQPKASSGESSGGCVDDGEMY